MSDAEREASGCDARAIAHARRANDEGRVIAIVGPTASGKTELALGLADALGGEIVSADSVQIYERFDIGSGKPSPDDLRRAPHHLIGTLAPLAAIDAARFAELALDIIGAVRARGRVPIVCGGTFLWQKALFFGLAEAPPPSAEIRARHKATTDAEGRPALHAMLAVVDPASAHRLHPNDFVRVSRALEIFEQTGERQSAAHERHAFKATQLAPAFMATAVMPEELSARIERRVASFLSRGLQDEVRALLAGGFGDARAMGAVGYKETRAFLDGELPEAELPEAIVRATRVYARRQRTWLNHVDVTYV